MPQEDIEGIFNSTLLDWDGSLEEVTSELRQKQVWHHQGIERGSERLGKQG